MRKIDSKIALIAITYNSSHLAEIFAETANNFNNVIIIDNASKDKSLQEYQKNIPNAKCIQSNVNLGYGKANNIGLRIAISEGCTHALIINPDCSISLTDTEILIDAIKSKQNVGLINPRITGADGTKTDIYTFDFERPYKEKNKKTINKVYDVKNKIIDSICIEGSCLLVRLDAFNSAGLFSEDLFLFCEEDDVALRMKRLGYTTAVATESTAIHLGGESTPSTFRLRLLKAYHVRWSRFWMTNKYISKSARILEVIKVLIYSPIAISIYLLSGNQKNFTKWLGWFLASLDGLFLTTFFRFFLR